MLRGHETKLLLNMNPFVLNSVKT
uniref:Uncharacterized protein n=1 Tax=Rhizophora mucronata TaxID=61149 RepID=A0A2P2NKZ6_RHIMU